MTRREMFVIGTMILIFVATIVCGTMTNIEKEDSLKTVAKCLAQTDRRLWDGACSKENVYVYANDTEAFVQTKGFVYENRLYPIKRTNSGKVIITWRDEVLATSDK